MSESRNPQPVTLFDKSAPIMRKVNPVIVVMSCLTGLTVSWGFYGLSAFTFSLMVGGSCWQS